MTVDGDWFRRVGGPDSKNYTYYTSSPSKLFRESVEDGQSVEYGWTLTERGSERKQYFLLDRQFGVGVYGKNDQGMWKQIDVYGFDGSW